MRKEVKLGMGIGGGVVAILVVYLLVAPPSGGKKGTQLVSAGGNGNGSLVDPSQTSDALNSSNTTANGNIEQPPVNGNALVEANLKKEAAPATRTDSNKATNGGSTPGKEQWSAALEKGNATKTLTPASGQTPAVKDEPLAKATPSKIEQSGTVVAEAGRQTHMYFDPNGAWGGGVSTDVGAIRATRVPAKNGLIAPAAGGAKAEAATIETTPVGRNSHVVRSGETFSSIAQAAYGSAAYYPHVLRANPNLNPSALRPGMVIHLPPAEEVKASAAAEKAAEKSAEGPAGAKLVEEVKIDTAKQYRVVAGDSLYKIGQKLYGTGLMGDKIYEANRQTIGPDSRKLKLGMILVLPEPPANRGGSGATAKAPVPEGARSTAEQISNSSEPYFGNDSDPK
jgi:nucleoid-associated protein YgaU